MIRYTVDTLRALELEQPDKLLILDYKTIEGHIRKGPMVSAYTSTSGLECVSIDSFTNTHSVSSIITHNYEKIKR